MKKVLAVASFGGHWIQLTEITKNLSPKHEYIYLTTSKDASKEKNIFVVNDANAKNKFLLIKQFFSVLKLIWIIKPDIILSTGASVGLFAIIAGKTINAKCIWVDSIANAKQMSKSGKLATYFTKHVFSQWKHINNVNYCGRLL